MQPIVRHQADIKNRDSEDSKHTKNIIYTQRLQMIYINGALSAVLCVNIHFAVPVFFDTRLGSHKATRPSNAASEAVQSLVP